MPRDPGLEALLSDDLADLHGLTQKPMFGGMVWLLRGNLLCGARQRGILMRLGKGNDAWALQIPGVTPMVMQGRPMSGWVNVARDAYADYRIRRTLLDRSVDFVQTLPPK